MDGIFKYQQLEEEFAEFAGYKQAVAVNNGTNALTLALAALGVGPGDEVIIPEFTMIACAWAVTYLGATPIFVDCDDTLNIDVQKIQPAITEKTKAIMPVHIYGRPCDMESICKIASAYGIYVVEDRSEIHGYKPKAKGDIACYSLYKNKIVSSQEGGVLTTDNEFIANKARNLKNMAFGPDHNYFHAQLGFNMRMPEVIAELALESLSLAQKNIQKRREWEERCDKALKGSVITLPKREKVWVYDFLCDDKDELVKYVLANGGQIRHFFKPMSMQQMYKRSFHELTAYKLSLFGAYIPYGEEKAIELIKEFYAKRHEAANKTKTPSNRPRPNRNSDKKSTRRKTQGRRN